MEEVLEHCDQRYETLVLTTPQPEFYIPFGFRIVEEHIFKVKCDSTGGTDGLRTLNFADSKDFTLLHRLLETRAPVSNIIGVVKEKPVFCVNEGSRPLYYAEDLDLIACMEIEDSRLHLFDVVTTQICSLKEILARILQPIEEVVIYFSPELLDVKDVQAFPYAFDDTVLMVRGTFAAEGENLCCRVLLGVEEKRLWRCRYGRTDVRPYPVLHPNENRYTSQHD